jgi:hypothetical protein
MLQSTFRSDDGSIEDLMVVNCADHRLVTSDIMQSVVQHFPHNPSTGVRVVVFLFRS